MPESPHPLSHFRWLLRPSWLWRHLVVLLIVTTCVSLGFWQLARMRQRAAFNLLLTERLTTQAQAWTRLAQQYQLDASVREPHAAAYRRAAIAGRYDTAREFLLHPRSRDGQPGFDLITPLIFAEGRAVLVDRGWIPLALDTPPFTPALPSADYVELEGFILPEQDPATRGLRPRDPAEGVLQRSYYVDVDRLQGQFPYQLEPAYLLLAKQEPPQQPSEVGVVFPVMPLAPVPDAGPHLSYALQWFSFATIGIVGYILLLRVRSREQKTTFSSLSS